MGLLDFRRGRTIGEEPQAERRNGNRLIVDDSKADPALVLGQAVLNAITDVVEELLKRRDEEAREDDRSESVAVSEIKEKKKEE